MIFENLSNPFEGNFLRVAERLTSKQFSRTISATNLHAMACGLETIELDEKLLESLSTRCWSPEIGSTQFGLYSDYTTPDQVPWLMTQARLGCYLFGLLPSVEFAATLPAPIAIAGHVIHAPYLRAVGSQGNLQLLDEDGQTILHLEETKKPGLMPTWKEKDRDCIVHWGSASLCTMSKGEWVQYWENENPRGPLASDWNNFRKELEHTLSILEAEVPHIYLWTSCLIKEVVPLADPGDGATNSRSFGLWPGQIQMSDGATFLNQVNMLVHECSHQYFHLARWFDTLVELDAPNVYSVLKDTERPLEKVLLGFHAFGNVWLTLKLLSKSNAKIDVNEMERQEIHVRNYVSALDGQLQKHCSPYIRPAGQAIYFPLRTRLAENGFPLSD